MTTASNVSAMNKQTSPTLDPEAINRNIDAACARIAPLWPLQQFVAVNPFFGLRDMSFQDASDTLARITGNSLYMSRDYYREQLASGRLTREDLQQALDQCDYPLSVDDIERALHTEAPQPKLGMAALSEVLERVEGSLWSSFVTERISLHCAAYFDLGQATIAMPWRDLSLYASWLEAAKIDRSPAMMGLKQFRAAIEQLPQQPRALIAQAVNLLGISDDSLERYLHASLMSIGGWAAWARYQRWQAELQGDQNDSLIDLLAIRLAWDMLLFQQKYSPKLEARWREMLAASMRPPSAKRQAAAQIDRVLQIGLEHGLQRKVIDGLAQRVNELPAERPSVQAAFCIDVRSEVFRRALETVQPNAQTVGFAGFFGIFIEHQPLGSSTAHSHVPVIFNPSYRIADAVKNGDTQAAQQKRQQRLGRSKAWKGFKLSAASCFSFVESTGLIYGGKLISDSFGWSRPVPDPHTQGLKEKQLDQTGPSLDAISQSTCCSRHVPTGIPVAERVEHAERILRSMSLTENFARLVVLAGHGSSSVNNPHASGLDCGACAGQTGEASARVVAALMNDTNVRKALRERGIEIPADTWFLAALHDTTTDQVELFDTDEVPLELSQDLAQLKISLEQASDLTRMERSALLGIEAHTGRGVTEAVQQRSRDWSQVRPEWALANNAAFIAAPRSRTTGLDLGGRAFLHDYAWQQDEEFRVLELIMSAPMVVANWINMQYYGSVADNQRFGSGNKVLHNVTGGAIGVLEGNGGDLRVGLSMQSLHDGKQWVHEPLRLSAFIEAPQAAIDAVIEKHELVRQLVENAWLHLFCIDENGNAHRRLRTGGWQPTERSWANAA